MRRALLGLIVAGCASASSVREKGLGHQRPGVTELAGAPRRFALLVGIDTFDDPRFPALRFAAADARALGSKLTGYASVRVLTTPEATLKAALLSELEALSREATHPQDTVLVYFSTHGTLARRPGAALERVIVTHDTRQDLLADTGLTVARVKAMLEAMPAQRKALVLALCHSGKGKSALSEQVVAQLAASKAPPAPALHEVSEGMLVLTACAYGETARESEAVGHDLYTHGLLTALERGDRDGDGAVTALEAHDFAREATFSLSGGEQRPTAEVELVGRDPVVLSGEVVRSSAPVLYSYAPAADGLRLRVDGAVKGSFPGGFALGPGVREVSIEDARSGAVLGATRVVLEPGARVDLTDALPPPPAWTLSLQPGFRIATHSSALQLALPFAVGGRMRLERSLGAFALGGSAGGFVGTGTLVGLSEAVPFRSHQLELTIDARWSPWTRLGLTGGIEVGWTLVVRDAGTQSYRSVQTVGAPSLAATAGWQRRVRTIAFGVEARGGLVALNLERDLVVSPLLGLEVFVGLVWP